MHAAGPSAICAVPMLAIELLVLLGLVLLNGVLAMSELAVVSSPRAPST